MGIKNTGQTTDYLSGSDEINVHLGVSAFFLFTADSITFRENTNYEIPAGSFSFPCFDGEALWVQLVEIDEVTDDSAFVSLDCKNLQIGTNLLKVELTEDSGIMTSAANVMDTAFGFSFGFGSAAGSGQDPASFELKFEVSEECT